MRTSALIVALAAALTLAACGGQSSSTSSDNASTAPNGGSNAAAGTTAAGGSSTAAAGEAPEYPGATMMAGGTAMGGASSGKVYSTSDSFDTVYKWYQGKMPAGSEKSHTTSPVGSAVFMTGEMGKDQQSVTITTQAGKTMITMAHVKM